uniref:Uncharacterized protein n=1 Tax=Rhipicephalus appendiculatus TaxID=34631 RepID=A0A131YG11_RHIAP
MMEVFRHNVVHFLGFFFYFSTLHLVPTHVVAVGNNQGNNRSYVIVLQDPPTILRSRLPTGNVRDPVKDRERSLLPLPPRPGQAFNNPVYLILGDQWERERMPLPAAPSGGHQYFLKGTPPIPPRDSKPKVAPPPRNRPNPPSRSLSLYATKPLPAKPPRRVNSASSIKRAIFGSQ